MSTYRVSHLSDARQIAGSINEARRKTDPLDLSSDQSTLLIDRTISLTGNFVVSGYYAVNSIQVVGPRITGWAADTGTANRASNASYAAGATLTFSASYTQSELTTLATRLAAVEAVLQSISQTQKAIKDDLLAHGLIGT